MAVVTININKREYEIACEDGQENKLTHLSYELDNRVRGLSSGVGTGNQTMLLIVAALQMLDEIYELRTAGADAGQVQQEIDKIASATITQITNRLNNLAEKFEKINP